VRKIGGRKLSDETKRRMSEGQKLRAPATEETRLKLSLANTGRKHTDVAKKNMSLAKQGEKHHLYGKHRSTETKKKISETNMGYRHTEEDKKKMSLLKIGGKHTEEHKRKIGEALKRRWSNLSQKGNLVTNNFINGGSKENE